MQLTTEAKQRRKETPKSPIQTSLSRIQAILKLLHHDIIYANMAGKSCLSRSQLFVVWLSLTIILGSQKPAEKLNNKANDVYVSSGLDVKHFPSRNSGSSRKYLRESCVPPSWKCVIGLKLGNITVSAAYVVLLAGDVMTNPGPVKDPCVVCHKGCRQNQKAIQCDSCDEWFHAKCINMKTTEYSELCDAGYGLGMYGLFISWV